MAQTPSKNVNTDDADKTAPSWDSSTEAPDKDGRYSDSLERVHIPSELFEGILDPSNNSVELLRKGYVGESIRFHQSAIGDLKKLLAKLQKDDASTDEAPKAPGE
jgi:hypothetical protein